MRCSFFLGFSLALPTPRDPTPPGGGDLGHAEAYVRRSTFTFTHPLGIEARVPARKNTRRKAIVASYLIPVVLAVTVYIVQRSIVKYEHIEFD